MKEAGQIAARIVDRVGAFKAEFKRAAAVNNGVRAFTPHPFEKIMQQVEESHILNFPSLSFKLAEYTVRSRISVTVCMHNHRSKIWVRLTCAKVDGRAACDLDVGDLQRFFSLASEKGETILPALADTYIDQVAATGVRVREFKPYSFQLRAFNCMDRRASDLCEKLRSGALSFSKALRDSEYRSMLLNYFSIVVGGKISTTGINEQVRTDELNVFGYKSALHDTLFTAKTTETETDLCGFGYDSSRKLDGDILAQATTRDLLKEYAQQF